MKQLQVSTPYCLIVTGLPGSGKTRFSKVFSSAFGAPFLEEGLIYALSADDGAAKELSYEMFDQFLKTQRTIIVEPNTGSRADRAEITKRARSAGYEPLTIWVQVDPTVAQQRSTTSTKTHKAYHTTETFNRAAKKFTAPMANEKACVISGMHTTATQLRVVLKRITHRSGRSDLSLTPQPRSGEPTQRPRLIQ